jgi:hypothetical protein
MFTSEIVGTQTDSKYKSREPHQLTSSVKSDDNVTCLIWLIHAQNATGMKMYEIHRITVQYS